MWCTLSRHPWAAAYLAALDSTRGRAAYAVVYSYFSKVGQSQPNMATRF
jgi:hypothetical protein